MDETFHDYTLATNLERYELPAVLPAVPGQTAPAVADSAGIMVLVGSLLCWSRPSGDGCSQVRELNLYSPATAASFVQLSQRHTTLCKADAAHSACFAVALQWPSTSTPSRTPCLKPLSPGACMVTHAESPLIPLPCPVLCIPGLENISHLAPAPGPDKRPSSMVRVVHKLSHR